MLSWFDNKVFYAITLALTLVGGFWAMYNGIVTVQNTQAIALATLQTRLTLLEQETQAMKADHSSLANEMRTALGQISNNVADLRYLEASRGSGKK